MTQETGQRAAAAQLLDRDVSEEYLREWTVHVSAEKTVTQTATKSIVIFRVGAELLALPTEVFQEVADHSAIHTLPHRRGGILNGLVNVRGELLLCAALEVLLGLEKAPEEQGTGRRASYSRLLVCGRKGGRFRVSCHRDLWCAPLQPERPERCPSNVKGSSRHLHHWHDPVERQNCRLPG